ncbi:MAG: AAA family ATPase [Actinobacteria bacterium]|nr:AAA family ATPase [Actinomycetota bacterium]
MNDGAPRGSFAGDGARSSGELLRRYRQRAGLTQEELGDRCGYTANYVGKLERGQRPISSAAADRLAAVLELGDEDRARLQTTGEHRGEPGPPVRPLVGRERELAEIRQHLAGAGPPVLLLAGEPGIGKSRLLEYAASRAEQIDWRVATGGCQRRAQDPYAPLTSALSHLLAQLPADDRTAALERADALGQMLPELAASDRRLALDAQPQQRRLLLFAEVARLLRAVAGEGGLLLVLDDLQWAGPDALDLIAALQAQAGSPPIRVLGAYRDSEPVAGSRLGDLVADLARASQVRVLDLEPLSDQEAGQLVLELSTQLDEAQALMPALVRRAGGVPFFLVSFVEDQLSADQGAQELTLPWTVKQVIGQRLLALPETAQELLAVAAIGGGDVSHALLVRAGSRSDDEVVEALEMATAARLLAEDPEGEYRFTHDLIRETIEAGLSAGRRRLLHRRVAETLASESPPRAELLAFHFASSDDPDRAIDYFELAGDQAQQRVAYAAAAEFFQQAIDRLRELGRSRETAAIGEKLGLALYRVGRYDEAISALESALERYRAADEVDSVHRLTGRLAEAHFRRGIGDDALERVVGLVEGSELKTTGTTSEGAILRWEGLGRLLFAQGSFKRMTTVGRSLDRVGRATGNKRLRLVGRRLQGAALIHSGSLREAAVLLETTIPAGPSAEGDDAAAEIATLLSAVYVSMGALQPSRALSERMLRVAESAGDQIVAAVHTVLLAVGDYVRGDWESGRRLLARAQASLDGHAPSTSSVRVGPVIAKLLIWDGRWHEAHLRLQASVRSARSMRIAYVEHAAAVHLAHLDLLEGRPEAAVARLQPLHAKDLPWSYSIPLLTTLGAAHLELGDPASARPYAERAVAAARRSEGWLHGIPALEVMGSVAAPLGTPDLADAVHREGLERARAMPFPYGEAHILRASALFDRERGDEASAEAKLSEALAILRRLGSTEQEAANHLEYR